MWFSTWLGLPSSSASSALQRTTPAIRSTSQPPSRARRPAAFSAVDAAASRSRICRAAVTSAWMTMNPSRAPASSKIGRKSTSIQTRRPSFTWFRTSVRNPSPAAARAAIQATVSGSASTQ